MTKITISETQRKVLEWLTEEGNVEEGYCYPFKTIMNGTKLDRREVRLACRALARKGLTEFHTGLWSEQTGEPAGAGYMASRAGEAFIKPCDVCGDRITFEYDVDEKGTAKFENGFDEKTVRTVRECEQHYKQSPKLQPTLV